MNKKAVILKFVYKERQTQQVTQRAIVQQFPTSSELVKTLYSMFMKKGYSMQQAFHELEEKYNFDPAELMHGLRLTLYKKGYSDDKASQKIHEIYGF